MALTDSITTNLLERRRRFTSAFQYSPIFLVFACYYLPIPKCLPPPLGDNCQLYYFTETHSFGQFFSDVWLLVTYPRWSPYDPGRNRGRPSEWAPFSITRVTRPARLPLQIIFRLLASGFLITWQIGDKRALAIEPIEVAPETVERLTPNLRAVSLLATPPLRTLLSGCTDLSNRLSWALYRAVQHYHKVL